MYWNHIIYLIWINELVWQIACRIRYYISHWTHIRDITRCASIQHGKVMGLMIATLIVRGMLWPQTGATHYHAQLGLLDNGRVIKGLVVCYVVWLGSLIYRMVMLTSARWSPVVVRMAIELKYCNTPYIHTDTYHTCQPLQLYIWALKST